MEQNPAASQVIVVRHAPFGHGAMLQAAAAQTLE
jgi:hypothetical protein